MKYFVIGLQNMHMKKSLKNRGNTFEKLKANTEFKYYFKVQHAFSLLLSLTILQPHYLIVTLIIFSSRNLYAKGFHFICIIDKIKQISQNLLNLTLCPYFTRKIAFTRNPYKSKLWQYTDTNALHYYYHYLTYKTILIVTFINNYLLSCCILNYPQLVCLNYVSLRERDLSYPQTCK